MEIITILATSLQNTTKAQPKAPTLQSIYRYSLFGDEETQMPISIVLYRRSMVSYDMKTEMEMEMEQNKQNCN